MERLTIMTPKGAALKMDATYPNETAAKKDLMKKYFAAVDRLAAYEDTGLEPEVVEHLKLASIGEAVAEITEFDGVSIDRLRELAQADKEGRCVVLPLVAMIEQSLQNGKMTPRQDQRFNGRYAVVYVDKKKWGSPLIDICGMPYNREQAESRRAELTREEAEKSIKEG